MFVLLLFRFVSDGTIDWPLVLGQTKNKTPIVLLYRYECEAVEKMFTTLATKRGITTRIINMTSVDTEHKLKSIIQKIMSAVSNQACRIYTKYLA